MDGVLRLFLVLADTAPPFPHLFLSRRQAVCRPCPVGGRRCGLLTGVEAGGHLEEQGLMGTAAGEKEPYAAGVAHNDRTNL